MECSNRLHGQRTGAFSWRPVLGLFRKTDQFRLDPTQNCAPGWWCDRESSVYHLALEMYSGIFRHATNPLALPRMPTKHQLHPCPHPTHHSHDYHTHTHHMSLTCCIKSHCTPATLAPAHTPCLFSIDLHTVRQHLVIVHFLLLPLLSGTLFQMMSSVPHHCHHLSLV